MTTEVTMQILMLKLSAYIHINYIMVFVDYVSMNVAGWGVLHIYVSFAALPVQTSA